MTNKQQPGDRCQVVTAHGTWLNATIISTREGHGGALVRVDGWSTDVWAKPSEIRPALRVVPEPDPHSTAYQGEVGDHQPRTTETVAKYGHVATDDEVREVNIELIAEVPTFSEATIREYGRDPYAPPLFPFNPNHGRDVNGTFTKPKPDPWAFLREMAEQVTTTSGILLPTVENHMASSMRPLGVSYDEQRKFIDAMAEFAKCGVTPEQVMEYVDAFARLIVTGITPRQLHDFAYQTMIDRTGHPDEGLHHITREYRGAR